VRFSPARSAVRAGGVSAAVILTRVADWNLTHRLGLASSLGRGPDGGIGGGIGDPGITSARQEHREIAREMGVSRNTARRYLRDDEAERYRPRPLRPTKLDPFMECAPESGQVTG
jgi:hypothetical protein